MQHFHGFNKKIGSKWGQKQHFIDSARNDRAMNAKQKVETTKVSIRFSKQFHEELKAAARANDWTVNAEINHRLRLVDQTAKIEALIGDVAELKSMLRQMQAD